MLSLYRNYNLSINILEVNCMFYIQFMVLVLLFDCKAVKRKATKLACL